MPRRTETTQQADQRGFRGGEDEVTMLTDDAKSELARYRLDLELARYRLDLADAYDSVPHKLIEVAEDTYCVTLHVMKIGRDFLC